MDELEERIAKRLTEALSNARFYGPEVRDQVGLVDLNDYCAGDDIYPHMTIADVARVVAEEARR